MKLQYYLILFVLFISSCNRSSKVNEYTAEASDVLIIKAKTNQLSQDDYYKILSQLDGMFEIVYKKAQQANEKGISIDSIRNYLATDAEYNMISQQAVVLDSVLTEYIKIPIAPKNLRNKYYQISSQAAKRAYQVGLN